MRTVTYRFYNKPILGIVVDNKVYNAEEAARATEVRGDFSSLRTVLEKHGGFDDLKKIAKKVASSNLNRYIALEDAELESPIMDPHKVLGVALNYYDFCTRGNIPIPEKLKVFGKYSMAVNRPFGQINIQGHQVTYEGELGVVIGKNCRNVKAGNALDYIAGYTIVNDCSANDYIKEDIQLFRGKNFDGFFPMGPVFVSADEIGDVGKLKLQTKVDDEVRQDSCTDQLIFGIPQIIEYFSAFMTLEPGDVIASGTPEGTALQFDPPRFLQPGQTVCITIEKIGTLQNSVVSSV